MHARWRTSSTSEARARASRRAAYGWCRTASLQPELQRVILDEHGKFVARVDFAWEQHRTVGEFDGPIKYGRTVEAGPDGWTSSRLKTTVRTPSGAQGGRSPAGAGRSSANRARSLTRIRSAFRRADHSLRSSDTRRRDRPSSDFAGCCNTRAVGALPRDHDPASDFAGARTHAQSSATATMNPAATPLVLQHTRSRRWGRERAPHQKVRGPYDRAFRLGAWSDHDHLRILVTRPAPTVRPPSRMANFSSSSMAMGWISDTDMSVLSPGITMSVPSGRFTTPVTSVVRK